MSGVCCRVLLHTLRVRSQQTSASSVLALVCTKRKRRELTSACDHFLCVPPLRAGFSNLHEAPYEKPKTRLSAFYPFPLFHPLRVIDCKECWKLGMHRAEKRPTIMRKPVERLTLTVFLLSELLYWPRIVAHCPRLRATDSEGVRRSVVIHDAHWFALFGRIKWRPPLTGCLDLFWGKARHTGKWATTLEGEETGLLLLIVVSFC